MSAAAFNIRVAPSLALVDAKAWDTCANPAGLGEPEAAGERYNPFVSSAFLLALERSKSVGAGTGWTPAHALVEDADGRLVAAAPAYLKTHSLGEYVFDQNWARAYEQMGGRYYPKVQVAVPFTPVTGRRLLVAKDAPVGAREALVAALRALREASGASSVHVTFATQPEARALRDAGFAPRIGEQFHFLNEGYGDFDDFLAALSSRKRKTIKRERREALGDDLTVDLLTGADIKPAHWDAFYAFYMDTGSRKWGRPYLTRAFFDHIGATMADRILLIMARRGERHIAGAINFLGDDAIYGRNWGAVEERPFLISSFATIRRSNSPFVTATNASRPERKASTSWRAAIGPSPPIWRMIRRPRFGAAVAEFLTRERAAVDELLADYEAGLPFRSEA